MLPELGEPDGPAMGTVQGSDMARSGKSEQARPANGRTGRVPRLAVLFLAMAGPGLAMPAAAANQGGLGGQSRGAITITASVAPRAIFAGNAVSAVTAAEHAQLELRCLRLTSRTGGYQLSLVVTEQSGVLRAVSPLEAVAVQWTPDRNQCRVGADARWLIGQASEAHAPSRAAMRLVPVLLTPL